MAFMIAACPVAARFESSAQGLTCPCRRPNPMICSSLSLLFFFFMSVISWWLTDLTNFRPIRLMGAGHRYRGGS